MNIKIMSAVFFISFFLSSTVFGQGIKFIGDSSWVKIKEKAQRENKPIFVDAYTTWCKPCKEMATEVFTQDAVGKYFNAIFISCKMDLEKGDGKLFPEQYEVRSIPTLLYFNDKGELIGKRSGSIGADSLIKFSQYVLSPPNQIPAFTKNYEESEKSLDDLLRYTKKLTAYGLPKKASEIAIDRLGKVTSEEKYTKQEWTLLTTYVNVDNKLIKDVHTNPLFKAVLENKEKYIKLMGKCAVNQYIDRGLKYNCMILGIREDDLDKYYAELEPYKPYINLDYYKAFAAYFFYKRSKKDEGKKFESEKNLLDNEQAYGRVCDAPAYLIYQMSYILKDAAEGYVEKDGERLSAAVRWAERSVKMDTANYKNKFVLARLLYRQGRYKEALSLAEQAAALLAKNPKEQKKFKLYNGLTIPDFIQQVKAKL